MRVGTSQVGPDRQIGRVNPGGRRDGLNRTEAPCKPGWFNVAIHAFAYRSAIPLIYAPKGGDLRTLVIRLDNQP